MNPLSIPLAGYDWNSGALVDAAPPPDEVLPWYHHDLCGETARTVSGVYLACWRRDLHDGNHWDKNDGWWRGDRDIDETVA